VVGSELGDGGLGVVWGWCLWCRSWTVSLGRGLDCGCAQCLDLAQVGGQLGGQGPSG
jgi:hypothetical protein